MKLTVVNNFKSNETYNKPPDFVFMEVNQRCNLRCNHCDFWKRNDDNSKWYLARDQKEFILKDFSEMNPNGKLVICGGEPMLDMDEYMFMAGTARKFGLRVLSVVNGTKITSQEIAENILTNGPHEVSISFDDWRPQEHDRLRGVKNSFLMASSAIRNLLKARERLNTDSKIIVMGLVHSGNYETLDSFYDFVLNDLGADKLKLNMIQPSFGANPLEKDPVFSELIKVNPNILINNINNCNHKYSLDLNPEWIDNVEMYFNSFSVDTDGGWQSVRTKEAICNSYERNIMIDHYGFAKLCFSEEFGGSPIIMQGDLKKFWNNASSTRSRMTGCKIPCGISHSVRKISATTQFMA